MPRVQEISRKDFEHSIERKVDIVIPFDPKAATQAAKLGQPLAKIAQSAKLSQPLNQLLTHDARAGRGGGRRDPSRRPAARCSASSALKAIVAKKPKEAAKAA